MLKLIFSRIQSGLFTRGLALARHNRMPGCDPSGFQTLRPDYVRIQNLYLIAQEISRNQVPGAVAELGVYQGSFAEIINLAFPDRDFYLFDTFEGFDARDVHQDVTNGYSTGAQPFRDTSVGKVLSRMRFPGRCIVRKGYFPDTAADLEGPFAFVSIDADLYAPILSGLEFFFRRLSPGGAIFVHDFNNLEYPGVRQAVQTFCRQAHLGFTPIPDGWGTAVIVKGS